MNAPQAGRLAGRLAGRSVVGTPAATGLGTAVATLLRSGARCAAGVVFVAVTAAPLMAQPGRGPAPGTKAPLAEPISADSLPDYVRRSAPTDPTIQRLWEEGMSRSQVQATAQVLLDSIGPRLTGSPNMTRGQNWAVSYLQGLGIEARKEEYGTWNAWKRGPAYVSLMAPRVKTLDATMLSWSGNTNGEWVEGGVVTIAPYSTVQEYRAWLPTVKGNVVLVGGPRLSCRMPSQIGAFGTPETIASLNTQQDAITATYRGLTQRVPTFYQDVKDAGALAVFDSNWSNYPGIQKIFGSPRNGPLPTIDIGCEDYGMLFRLAENNQGPVVRVMAESESLGEQPVFNVVGTIRGSEKPNEYVMLSAHFDSWEGHSGATDNGTGSLTMLEAIRILKTVYPTPRRTIMIGLWSGEEQGLNGSGSFSEDHPEIVAGLQFLFNQDNGTGRIVSTGPNIIPENGDRLAQYMSAMPRQLTEWIRLQGPSGIGGGTDHVSFVCRGAPAVTLNALSWDYSFTTWHTQRDSYDKVIMDDLKHNATLTAMLAYMASEDPERSSRNVMSPIPGSTPARPITIPSCGAPTRKSTDSRR